MKVNRPAHQTDRVARSRAIGMAALGGAVSLLLLTPGCQQVDAKPDFQRASAIVTSTTGYELSYRPEDEGLVADRVGGLLRDGLTPTEAVEVGLLNNPSLQAAFMDVGIARADVVQAGLLSNPSLGISARFPSGGGLANIEADLAQNVADLWRIKPRTRAAERNLDAAVLDLARQAADLSAAIETAYYEAVGRAQVQAIAEQNLATARELLQMASVQREHGAATEIDVNLSRSVVFESELESQSARLATTEARRSLAQLLGLTTDADELVLTAALPEPPTGTLNAAELVATARESRLDLRAAWQRVDAAEAELARERRNTFGDVTVGVSMERGERRSGEPSEYTDLIVGPTLAFEIPIFDQNQAGEARAAFSLQRAIKTLEAIERPIVHEIHGAVDRSDTAWRLVRLYREQSLPLAESNVALSREAYRAGRTSLLGVMEAQRFLLTTRRRYVEAWMGAAETTAALNRAVARPQATATQPDSTETTESGGPNAGNEDQP